MRRAMEKAMQPRISALLCTRNRPAKLRRAIKSILANSFGSFELIVVDQSTTEESRIGVESFCDPRLIYIRTATVGLSRSRNIAIQSARADIVAFTDDDCVCDADWLSSIVAEFERDPTTMAVFGRVVAYGNKRPDMVCPCLIEARERRVVDAPAIPFHVLGSGNNMSFKKDVFRRIGLFIESLGAGTPMKGGEDMEFVYRALRRRLKFVYAPEPLVYHDNWSSLAQYEGLARAYIFSGALVLTRFALLLDRIAITELARMAYYILRNKLGAGNAAKALGSYLFGCAMGVWYALVSPPKLTERAHQATKAGIS
jgi:glycosyltransferase involved in cell wall biosynthesis